MKKILFFLLITLSLVTVGNGCSTTNVDSMAEPTKGQEKSDESINHFKGYTGTFVLRDLKNNTTIVINENQANKRVPPMSTFKIFNSLVALQTGVIKDENEVKKWDGTMHSIEAWNRDHTLATAIKDSVVWYYQELARDIGEGKMNSYIQQIGYGNNDTSGGIDKFWLDSSLQITAKEQVDFLAKLYKEELPFDREVMKKVKKIMTISQTKEGIYAGKTGAMLGKIGWFVGFITKGEKAYVFATNIEGNPKASGVIAKEITGKILKDMKLLTN